MGMPYNLTDINVFINVTVEGTRFYTHELVIYKPAPEEFCANIPEGFDNVLDDGVCGVNGYAKGGDVYRTSTHDKDEYAITVKSSGLYAEASHGASIVGDHDEDHHEGHLRRGMLFRMLQEGESGHHGHGGGGGVEHPLHGVDNVLFAADSSQGNSLAYSVKTFSTDFDKYEARAGKFDLISSFEIETAKYSCKRAPQEKWVLAISKFYDAAKVTEATRELLNMEKHGCLVTPCATEEEWCTQDPSCSESPYKENDSLKASVVATFIVLGAVIILAVIVVYYRRKINQAKTGAKKKFAQRLRMSVALGSSAEEGIKDYIAQRNELIQKFDRIDADSSGLITREDLWKYLISKGSEDIKMNETEFDALFKDIDTDGSGTIDFTEFAGFMGQLEEKK
eukprot:13733411-Ditylum_brightwellii.AAC.1